MNWKSWLAGTMAVMMTVTAIPAGTVLAAAPEDGQQQETELQEKEKNHISFNDIYPKLFVSRKETNAEKIMDGVISEKNGECWDNYGSAYPEDV